MRNVSGGDWLRTIDCGCSHPWSQKKGSHLPRNFSGNLPQKVSLARAHDENALRNHQTHPIPVYAVPPNSQTFRIEAVATALIDGPEGKEGLQLVLTVRPHSFLPTPLYQNVARTSLWYIGDNHHSRPSIHARHAIHAHLTRFLSHYYIGIRAHPARPVLFEGATASSRQYTISARFIETHSDSQS